MFYWASLSAAHTCQYTMYMYVDIHHTSATNSREFRACHWTYRILPNASPPFSAVEISQNRIFEYKLCLEYTCTCRPLTSSYSMPSMVVCSRFKLREQKICAGYAPQTATLAIGTKVHTHPMKYLYDLAIVFSGIATQANKSNSCKKQISVVLSIACIHFSVSAITVSYSGKFSRSSIFVDGRSSNISGFNFHGCV